MASFLSRVYQFVKIKSILRLSAKTEGSGLTLSVTFSCLSTVEGSNSLAFLFLMDQTGADLPFPFFIE